MICKQCGSEIPVNSAFCMNCGVAVERNSMLLETEPTPKAGNIKKRIVVLLSVAVVAVGCVALISQFASRCEVSGCKREAEYGDYCIYHVCLAGSCINRRSYGSDYCYLHEASYSYAAEDDLEFSDIALSNNSSYTVCVGTVTNTGNRTYEFVKVKGSFKDDYSGNVIDTDWTYVVGSEGLAPGESKTFRMSVPKDYDIDSCSISILDYD